MNKIKKNNSYLLIIAIFILILFTNVTLAGWDTYSDWLADHPDAPPSHIGYDPDVYDPNTGQGLYILGPDNEVLAYLDPATGEWETPLPCPECTCGGPNCSDDGETPPSGDSCGGSCYCCRSHTEPYTVTNPDGTTSTRSKTVCDKYCKTYTCYWKECSGCCCVSRSSGPHVTDCGAHCYCPPSTCSGSGCSCCSKGPCYPIVHLTIDPPKLFVNQSFNLSYQAEGDSCCGGIRCQVTATYQGYNCTNGQVPANTIGICPSEVQGVNVCDPTNKLRTLASSSGSATITTHSQYWGNCLYKVTCTNSCGKSNYDQQTVMTVPVPLWGEESPISNLLSPLKPFISLFPL